MKKNFHPKKFKWFLIILLLGSLIACGAGIETPLQDNHDPVATSSASGDGWLTPEQKHRAEQITSLFENDTIELQYAYVENIQDGRGYTAGRAGFTTATGDALEVVELYSEKSPNNALEKFLPRLRELANSHSDHVDGLEGFQEAWTNMAKDPIFRSSQDEIVDREYYRPAMEMGDKLGLKTALARAALYDTIIQHGGGEDPDGLPAVIANTQQFAGGSPKTGIDEAIWLKAFLKERREVLEHASDPATREAWAESTYRVDVLSLILDSGNLDLHGPIPIKVDWFDLTIP